MENAPNDKAKEMLKNIMNELNISVHIRETLKETLENENKKDMFEQLFNEIKDPLAKFIKNLNSPNDVQEILIQLYNNILDNKQEGGRDTNRHQNPFVDGKHGTTQRRGFRTEHLEGAMEQFARILRPIVRSIVGRFPNVLNNDNNNDGNPIILLFIMGSGIYIYFYTDITTAINIASVTTFIISVLSMVSGGKKSSKNRNTKKSRKSRKSRKSKRKSRR